MDPVEKVPWGRKRLSSHRRTHLLFPLQLHLLVKRVLVGCLLGVLVYTSYLYFHLIAYILAHGPRVQEHRLKPALFSVILPPIGLFIFAWTARKEVHWIVPTIGFALYAGSVFVIFEGIMFNLPMSYPAYAASLFAGNDFCRSSFATGAIMFSRAMYDQLGVEKGVSLLAGLSVAGIFGVFCDISIWGSFESEEQDCGYLIIHT